MLGLALEGGGAKGAFHVGALKALFERGYAFDGIAGTSIGALNGAIVAQGDFPLLEDIWRNASFSTLTGLDDDKFNRLLAREYDRDLLRYVFNVARKTFKNRGLPMDKIREFAETYIDESRLRASKVDYCMVTVSISDNWTPLELFKEDIPEGKLTEYILTSAYFPVFNRPEVEGKSFMDGGMYNNCPVTPLVHRGYRNIIGIRTGSRMPSRKVLDKSVKVDYIDPSENLGTTLDFRKEKIARNIKLGYYDALRFTDKLMGVKYYLRPKTYAESINYLENFSDKAYVRIAEILGAQGNRRELMARAAEVAAEELKLDTDVTAIGAVVAMFEYVAGLYGVEKFRIYSTEEFVSALNARWTAKAEDVEFPKVYEIVKALVKGA